MPNHVFYDACESGNLEIVRQVVSKEVPLTWSSPVFLSKGLAHALAGRKHDTAIYILDHVHGLQFGLSGFTNSMVLLRSKNNPLLQEAVCRSWSEDPTLSPKDLGKNLFLLFTPMKKSFPLWHDLKNWEPLMSARSGDFFDQLHQFMTQALSGSYAKSDEHKEQVQAFLIHWERLLLQQASTVQPSSTKQRKL